MQTRRHNGSPNVVLVDTHTRHNHGSGIARPRGLQKGPRHVLSAHPCGVLRIGFRRRRIPCPGLQKIVVEVTHASTELPVFRTQETDAKDVGPKGVLLAFVMPVAKSVPMMVGGRRPLAAPRTAFLTGEHVAHLGVDFGALNFCAGGPRGSRNAFLFNDATVAVHVHTQQGEFCTQTAVPDKPPLIPDDKILLQRRVQEPTSPDCRHRFPAGETRHVS